MSVYLIYRNVHIAVWKLHVSRLFLVAAYSFLFLQPSLITVIDAGRKPSPVIPRLLLCTLCLAEEQSETACAERYAILYSALSGIAAHNELVHIGRGGRPGWPNRFPVRNLDYVVWSCLVSYIMQWPWECYVCLFYINICL